MSKTKNLYKRLVSIWPLLFGVAMFSTSNGLQGTLLGLRGSTEGFSTQMIGVIMSVYFLGFLFGCRIIPKLIFSVGHIRVFAALASIASTTILLHGIFVHPLIWIPIRLMTGFCFCGLFIITESWLNQVSNKKQRGIIFSLYVAIVNGGMLVGQLMINLAPLNTTSLFILVSLLISLALAPITLTNKPTPRHRRSTQISFTEMLRRFPMPMVGVFISGICNSTILGLAPVFGNITGMDKAAISIYMGCYILGNASLPIILGAMSDKVDRRLVIHFAAIMGLISTVYLYFQYDNYAFILILGGMITSLYSVSITYMNDQIKKAQIVAASRSLLMFNAIGAMLGPLIGGFALTYFGAQSFYIVLSIYMFVVFVIAIYRTIVGKRVKRKRDFVAVPVVSAPSVMRLNADAPLPAQTTPEQTPSPQVKK